MRHKDILYLFPDEIIKMAKNQKGSLILQYEYENGNEQKRNKIFN